jgi:dihydrofolate reductase
MSELIYHVATTVDNFIAGPDGEVDESIFSYEGEHVSDFLTQIQQYDCVLMGGKTYAYGFQFGLKAGQPAYQGIKHYVFSKTLDFTANEEVALIKENAVAFVKHLKQTPNQKIWLCGGGQLAGSLLEAALIDKLILKVNPVLIGKGIPLFGTSGKQVKLEKPNLKQYKNGVILASYRIKK